MRVCAGTERFSRRWKRASARASPWLGVAQPAATVLLLLLLNPGVAAAGKLQIGAGSTMQLGDGEMLLGCTDLIIATMATLEGQSSTIRLAGNWSNAGTFDPGTGTVVFEDGCSVPGMSNIDGSTTFFDLIVTTSTGKTVKFEAGSTQTILDHLTLTGAPGNLLVIRSSVPGQRALLDLTQGGTQQIDYVDVADNGASGRLLAPGSPQSGHSIDSGNNTGWFVLLQSAAPVMSGMGLLACVLVLLALARGALARSPGERTWSR